MYFHFCKKKKRKRKYAIEYFIILEVQSQINMLKKLSIFSAKISQFIFLPLKWILKNKIIIQHLNSKLEKVQNTTNAQTIEIHFITTITTTSDV